MIREVLRMGDPRLWRVSAPVETFGTRDLEELLQDMRDTMAAQDGAGLAAPQIGVPLQVVIFGVQPESLETSLGLTPAVAAQLDELVDLVAAEIHKSD